MNTDQSPSDQATTLVATEAPATMTENLLAFSFCFFIPLAGVVVNMGTNWIANRIPSIHGSFTQLCLSLAVADSGVLTTYVLFYAPMMLMFANSRNSLSLSQFHRCRQSSLPDSMIGYVVGQLSLLFWFTSLYAIFFVTLNRMVAVMFPVKYTKIFSSGVTAACIALCWILGVLHSCLYVVPGCHFFLDVHTWLFAYEDTPCGNFAAFVLDFGYAVVFTILIFGLNMITLIRLRNINLQHTLGCSKEEAKYRKGQEYRFFWHTSINGLVLEIMLVSFHYISAMSEGRWFWFWTTTMIWAISHSSSGFLFLAFNQPVRKSVTTFLMTGKVVDFRGGSVNRAKSTSRFVNPKVNPSQHQNKTSNIDNANV